MDLEKIAGRFSAFPLLFGEQSEVIAKVWRQRSAGLDPISGTGMRKPKSGCMEKLPTEDR